jgi:AcrR family transcriptional regulator
MHEIPTPRAEATRQAIVTTAERLFREIGYQKTAVADIARDLRMSPANIYRFFPSKSAINEAIAERLLGGLSQAVWAVARGTGPADTRMRHLFTLLQQQTIALFFKEKRMHDMVGAAMAENWEAIDHFIRDIDTALRHIVMDGQVSGLFDRSLDADATGRLIHAAMLGFCHPTIIEQCADDDLPALAAGMAEFALRALRP